MRMGRFWGRKETEQASADLPSLVGRIQEGVVRAGEQLEREAEAVIAKAEDGLHSLDAPELRAVAHDDDRVRRALEQIDADARERIERLRAVGESRRAAIERSREALGGLLELALRPRR
jgi:hypothetical protein